MTGFFARIALLCATALPVLPLHAQGFPNKPIRLIIPFPPAGITDLSEFSRLLVEAFAQVPQLKTPVVARLVGTNLDAARDFLSARHVPVTTDLAEAITHVRRHLA